MFNQLQLPTFTAGFTWSLLIQLFHLIFQFNSSFFHSISRHLAHFLNTIIIIIHKRNCFLINSHISNFWNRNGFHAFFPLKICCYYLKYFPFKLDNIQKKSNICKMTLNSILLEFQARIIRDYQVKEPKNCVAGLLSGWFKWGQISFSPTVEHNTTDLGM